MQKILHVDEWHTRFRPLSLATILPLNNSLVERPSSLFLLPLSINTRQGALPRFKPHNSCVLLSDFHLGLFFAQPQAFLKYLQIG